MPRLAMPILGLFVAGLIGCGSHGRPPSNVVEVAVIESPGPQVAAAVAGNLAGIPGRVLRLARIAALIPLPLPRATPVRLIPSCAAGWAVVVAVRRGRRVWYGPCQLPGAIERLRRALLRDAGNLSVQRPPLLTRFLHRNGEGIWQQFPSYVGAVPCVIGGGGPAPGVRIRGRCTTALSYGVHGRGGAAILRFSEAWPRRIFSAGGRPVGGWLMHTWVFAISSSGHIVAQADSGDPPPQFIS